MPTCSKHASSTPNNGDYEEQLRRLASELALSEERQRREIAEDLHDHLGQGLAMLRLKLVELRGNAVFCGLDHTIDEMDKLLGQIIRYTRSLTFELSPPVLYELGLGPALEWLAEQYAGRHALTFDLDLAALPEATPSPLRVMLFKSVRELVFNIVKHAEARRVRLAVYRLDNELEIVVEDDGKGFDDPAKAMQPTSRTDQGFGLFSICERMKLHGGALRISRISPHGSRVTMSLPLAACKE